MGFEVFCGVGREGEGALFKWAAAESASDTEAPRTSEVFVGAALFFVDFNEVLSVFGRGVSEIDAVEVELEK